MAYPRMNAENSVQMVQDVFAGLNRNLRAGENECADMKNLTGEEYPVMATRKKRSYGADLSAPGGLITKDSLVVVDNGKLIYNGDEIEGLELTDGVKQLVSMGAYLLIWPDKKWLNTKDFSESGRMENEAEISGTVTAYLCKQDGTKYEKDKIVIAESAPSTPVEGDLWMDVSGDSPALNQYANDMWVGIATVYVRLEAQGIDVGFSQYDGVIISGLNGALESLNGSHVLQKVEPGAITVIGILYGTDYTSDGVTVERKVPDMDYVTECGNRIWGCKYGLVDSKPVNEIYASKLGDFKNWNCFQGISTDSYVASRGSDGAFTGAITLQGHPLFFKENCVEKVFPSATGAHQIVTTECRGVQNGSWRSLAIVDETVYYKSRSDVCAYGGSLPASVSEALGEVRYSNARAGAAGGLYYISMCDAEGVWHMMVYDTVKQMWHEEDNTCAMMFAECDGDLWWIDEITGDLVCRTDYGDGESEEDFAWRWDSGIIGFAQPEQKYLSRFTVRADLEAGAKIEVFLSYDGGAWQKKISYARPGLRSFNIPVLPRRCDHVRLRISGVGGCKVYSVSKHLEGGSEQAW